jgi:HicB-like protein involved in pilus formation
VPLTDRDFPSGPRSGRLCLRMPSTLHEAAARAAAAEDVSLNLFICTTLARAVGWEAREPPPREARKTRYEIQWDLWMERRGAGRRS